MKASNNTGIVVLLGKGTSNCHVKLAVRNSVSVPNFPSGIMDQALTPNCLRFSMLFRTFLLLPVEHNSHMSYIRPGQYQLNVLYDPACSLTTNTAETMQHEEVAGAAPNGIVGNWEHRILMEDLRANTMSGRFGQTPFAVCSCYLTIVTAIFCPKIDNHD